MVARAAGEAGIVVAVVEVAETLAAAALLNKGRRVDGGCCLGSRLEFNKFGVMASGIIARC